MSPTVLAAAKAGNQSKHVPRPLGPHLLSIAFDSANGDSYAAHLGARHRQQPFSGCASLSSSDAVIGDASTRTRRDAASLATRARSAGQRRGLTAVARIEDWRERPEGFVELVRAYHVPSFVEYGEYPHVTSDEVKKALRLKAAFSDMRDQMR